MKEGLHPCPCLALQEEPAATAPGMKKQGGGMKNCVMSQPK